MSHQISQINGKAEMAYAGKRPWHGLGTQVPGLMTTKEALQLAHLDWQVKKVPVLSSLDLTPVPGAHAIIRTDTNQPLGVVGDRYEPIGNTEAFAFFDIALGEGQGQIDTAGALGRGERVWMLAKMPDQFEAVPGDPVERYLLCWNSHDGSKSLEVLFTSIRVVCNNTLTAAIHNCSHKVAIRHTASWEDRLKQAHLMLEASSEYWSQIREICKRLAQTSVSRVEVGAFMDAMFPPGEENGRLVHAPGRQQVLRLMEEGKGSDIPGVRGTAWGMFNAYTEWLDHERRVHNDSDRWVRSTFGSGVSERQRAFNILLNIE